MQNKARHPLVIAIVSFLVLLAATQYLAYQAHLIAKEREQEELRNELTETKGRFKDILDLSISSANTIAILYKQYGELTHFDSIAKQLMEFDKSIDLINVTDKYIISHVYPPEGNEMTLGGNLLDFPTFKKEAEIALKNKEIRFAGPYKMMQGRGIAVSGRVPIIVGDTFKGLVNVITKLPRFFNLLPQFQNKNGRYVYQLTKVNPITNKPETFFPGYEPRDGSGISAYMPEGNWTLTVAYAHSYPASKNALVISLLGVLLSIAVGLVIYNRSRRTSYLEQQIAASTHNLRERVKELTTIYEVNEILSDDSQSIDDVFEKIVRVLPGGWQFPEVCAACVKFDGRRFATDNYVDEGIKQTAAFVLQDGRRGTIEVVYLKKMPTGDEGPFMKEERNLINAIAETIQVYFNKKINQDAVTHSEELFRNLVERSLVGVYIIQKDRFVYVNPKMIEESGYEERELLERPFLDFIVEEDKPTVLGHVKSRMKGYDGEARYEVRISRKDGAIMWTEMYGTTTLFEGEKALIGTIVNVTDRKNLEVERQRIINKLVERNNDLEEFNQILSHSVRSPLATILGLSNFIKDVQSDEERRFTAEGIVTSAKQLDSVLANLNKILGAKKEE